MGTLTFSPPFIKEEKLELSKSRLREGIRAEQGGGKAKARGSVALPSMRGAVSVETQEGLRFILNMTWQNKQNSSFTCGGPRGGTGHEK